MTRGVEDGQKASVFVALACHTWCFWTPKRPISIHCVIRQQSPESKGRRGAVNCAHLGRRCIPQGAMNCAPSSLSPQHICFHDRRIGKAHSSSDLCVILIAICFTCFTCFTCIGRSGIRISSGSQKLERQAQKMVACNVYLIMKVRDLCSVVRCASLRLPIS